MKDTSALPVTFNIFDSTPFQYFPCNRDYEFSTIPTAPVSIC